jgi:hypothetical protein
MARRSTCGSNERLGRGAWLTCLALLPACGSLLGVDFGDAHPLADGGSGGEGSDGDAATGADGSSMTGSDGAVTGDGAHGPSKDGGDGDAGAGHDAPSAPDGCATGCTGPLASNQANPRAIAIDGNNVYWANQGVSGGDGSIVSIPKSGGTPVTLASGLSAPTALSVRTGYVYWTDQGDGMVMRAQVGAANSGQSIAFGQSSPTGIGTDDTNVYWTNGGTGSDGTLQKEPLDGGTATTLAANLLGPGQLAIDAYNAYFALDTGGIVYTSLAGGDSIHDLAYDGMGGVPAQVTVYGTQVFWTDLTTNAVYQSSTDGGGAQSIAGGTQPEGIATDGVNVYFTDRGSGAIGSGSVDKVPVGGGGSSTVAPSQSYAWGVAVDATYVYWTAAIDGTVNRAPK